MKPRVLQLTSAHRWDDVRIFLKISQTLVEAGYDVHLMAPQSGKGCANSSGDVTLHQTQQRTTRLARLLLASTLWWKAHRLKPDIVHIHDPELIPSAIVLRLLGHNVIYDVHEDYPEKIAEKKWIPFGLRTAINVLFRLLETVASRLFTANIAVTDHIARRFPQRNTVVVRNYPILAEQTSVSTAQRTSILYVGGLDSLRGVREMVLAFEKLNSPSTPLDLLGTFSDPTLESWVAEKSEHLSIHLRGWCDRAAVALALDNAVVGLVVLHPTPAYEASLPIKLFEYMAAGVPVIASNFDGWRSMIEDAECGILVDPLDPRAIAEAMEWMLHNKQEASAMGERGRLAVIEKYDWATEARTLLGLYEKLGSTHA